MHDRMLRFIRSSSGEHDGSNPDIPDRTADGAVYAIRVPAATRSRLARWCAWQIATASASAASARRSVAPGNRRRTIIATCSLVAAPVPTTARFTSIAPYSDTAIPASAGASSATPRA